jgi:hypothetical protein
MANNSELSVRQQGVIISAQYHNVSEFTPEFLFTSKIVPSSWVCRLADQTPESSIIDDGYVQWEMTTEELRIIEHPNILLQADINDNAVVGAVSFARNFLVSAPYLPSRKLWSFWRVICIDPDSEKWALETFMARGWPSRLGDLTIHPRLNTSIGDFRVQVSITSGSGQEQQGGPPIPSTVFDCFVWKEMNQSPPEMTEDLDRWAEKARILEDVIGHLVQSGS